MSYLQPEANEFMAVSDFIRVAAPTCEPHTTRLIFVAHKHDLLIFWQLVLNAYSLVVLLLSHIVLINEYIRYLSLSSTGLSFQVNFLPISFSIEPFGSLIAQELKIFSIHHIKSTQSR